MDDEDLPSLEELIWVLLEVRTRQTPVHIMLRLSGITEDVFRLFLRHFGALTTDDLVVIRDLMTDRRKYYQLLEELDQPNLN